MVKQSIVLSSEYIFFHRKESLKSHLAVKNKSHVRTGSYFKRGENIRGKNWDEILPSDLVRSKEPYMGASAHRGAPAEPPRPILRSPWAL